MCRTCYGRTWRAGEIADARHRISDLNLEDRTGVCSVCGPVDVKIRWRNGRMKTECREKVRGDNRKWAERNPEKRKPWTPTDSQRRRYSRRYRLSKYGLTDEQYRDLEERSKGGCMICGKAFEGVPYIDHCHKSGEVRGLLCSRCNFALGWLNDDPATALAAHMYLVANGN